MSEEPLPGGHSRGAVRVGDTVRRPWQPWTGAVHGLLRHLESAGFQGAPRVLGSDGEGREVLSYLRGDVAGEQLPWPAWVHSDSALTQVGQWLRRLHDVSATYVPPPDAIWFARQTWRPGLVFGHHDAAPYNAVWSGDTLVGFVDWDTAGPSPAELDLAFTALSWVPLQARRIVAIQGFTDFDDRSRRLHLLLDAYGYQADRSGFAEVTAARARLNADGIRRMAAAGDPVGIALLPSVDELEEAAREVEELPAAFWVPPRPS